MTREFCDVSNLRIMHRISPDLHIIWCWVQFNLYRTIFDAVILVFRDFFYSYISRRNTRKFIKLHVKSGLEVNWCLLHLCVYLPTGGGVLLSGFFHDISDSYFSRIDIQNFIKPHIYIDLGINWCWLHFSAYCSKGGGVMQCFLQFSL